MTAPSPPGDIAKRHPNRILIPAGRTLHRFYSIARDPIFFDTGVDGRLNAPDGSYGVLYAAHKQTGAFAEAFLRVPGRTQLPDDLIARKAYVRIGVKQPLNLAKLAGKGLARLGATAEVTHDGLPYDVPQSWSAALHAHPAGFDGIVYTARHDDEQTCFAIFDRASDKLEEAGRVTDLDAEWFYALANAYDVGVAPPPA